MPAVLAGAGTSSLITLAVIAGGAMLLAALFGQLTRRVHHAAQVRHRGGHRAGQRTRPPPRRPRCMTCSIERDPA
jgi:basic amino acid/polyamine antiporter, APA family